MAVKAASMSKSSGGRCPVCRQPSEHANRPFCSKRCADVDLARWLGGRYVIAGSNDLADEDAVEGPQDPGAQEPHSDADGEG